MLQCSGNEFGGSLARCSEGVENFAGDVALDASHDFVFGFAFGDAPGDVVTGGLVAAHAHDQDDVQSAVGVAVAVTPKSSWPWVHTLLHSIFDRPVAESVLSQYDRVLDVLSDKLPKVAEHLDSARDELLAFTAFPKQIWRQIWSDNPRSDSTRRSTAAPTSSASSPAAPPSFASSGPCLLNSTTNGSKAAATSAWTSSTEPAP
jgi:hypothetical protein